MVGEPGGALGRGRRRGRLRHREDLGALPGRLPGRLRTQQHSVAPDPRRQTPRRRLVGLPPPPDLAQLSYRVLKASSGTRTAAAVVAVGALVAGCGDNGGDVEPSVSTRSATSTTPSAPRAVKLKVAGTVATGIEVPWGLTFLPDKSA